MPFIIWAAFRFGQREVTTATPRSAPSRCGTRCARERRTVLRAAGERVLLLLLAFVSTVVVTGLMLCAVLAQLDAARDELERSVRERSARGERAPACG